MRRPTTGVLVAVLTMLGMVLSVAAPTRAAAQALETRALAALGDLGGDLPERCRSDARHAHRVRRAGRMVLGIGSVTATVHMLGVVIATTTTSELPERWFGKLYVPFIAHYVAVWVTGGALLGRARRLDKKYARSSCGGQAEAELPGLILNAGSPDARVRVSLSAGPTGLVLSGRF